MGAVAGNPALIKVKKWGKKDQEEYDLVVAGEDSFATQGSMDYDY